MQGKTTNRNSKCRYAKLNNPFIYLFSGVRTPLGNIFTAALVVASLLFFTPYFSFIPKATLAAIIIAAVVFMVEVKVIKPMWRSKSKIKYTKTTVRRNIHKFFCFANFYRK